MARLITPGGDVKYVIPYDNVCFSHSELMDAVGGWCEMLPLCYVQGDARRHGWLVFNPHGMSVGMTPNPAATMIVRNAGYNEVVAGDAILCRYDEVR